MINENEIIFTKKLGSGSFGKVYLLEIKNKKKIKTCAGKVECIENGKKNLLKKEYDIYLQLNKKKIINEFIPKIYDYIEMETNNLLLMELLGDDLNKIFNNLDKNFSIQTILKIGIEMTTIIKKLHLCGYIHCDIKPNNFSIGYSNKNKIYMIDLGLSQKYLIDNVHIKHKINHKFIGTARYASLNIHYGSNPSRRDDLISIGYVLLYFILGDLPWIGLKKTKDLSQTDKIFDKKASTDLKILQSNYNIIPDSIILYLTYCEDLKFEDEPDYNYLLNLLSTNLFKINYTDDFDWL